VRCPFRDRLSVRNWSAVSWAIFPGAWLAYGRYERRVARYLEVHIASFDTLRTCRDAPRRGGRGSGPCTGRLIWGCSHLQLQERASQDRVYAEVHAAEAGIRVRAGRGFGGIRKASLLARHRPGVGMDFRLSVTARAIPAAPIVGCFRSEERHRAQHPASGHSRAESSPLETRFI